jgi:hypothetical protein
MTFGGDVQVVADVATVTTIAVVPIALGVRRVYRRTIGSRAALARQLAKLSCGTRSAFVDGMFGTPEFERTKERQTERVYITPHAYVQTVSDQDDAITWWAVTTTTRKFSPRFTLPPMSSDGRRWSVRLGNTRFAQLADGRTTIRWLLGASRAGYSECYYFGNPGSYQTYVVSHSDASTVRTIDNLALHELLTVQPRNKPESPTGEFILDRPEEFEAAAAPLRRIRRVSVVNTFGVGLDFNAASFPWSIGADAYLVRLLHTVEVTQPRRLTFWWQESRRASS